MYGTIYGNQTYGDHWTGIASYAPEITGGGVAGGTGTTSCLVIFSGTGGGVIGGTAALIAKVLFLATGGGVAGGSVSFGQKITFTMIGGAVAGGTIRPWGGFYVSTPIAGVTWTTTGATTTDTWADVAATDASIWETFDE